MSAVVDFLTSNPILAAAVVAAIAFIAYDILVSRRRHRAKRVALGSSIIPAGVLPSSQSAAKSGTVDSLGPGESIEAMEFCSALHFFPPSRGASRTRCGCDAVHSSMLHTFC